MIIEQLGRLGCRLGSIDNTNPVPAYAHADVVSRY